MAPQKLTGLRPQAYEHPSDTATLNALTHTAGLDTLIRKLNSWGFERIVRVQLTGSYLRATPDTLSDLYETLTTARELIDLPLLPELYVAGSGELNAITAGVEHPLILLYSAAVEQLTPEERLFVIAHEMGHIKSGHVLYYQMAEFLPAIAQAIGSVTLGIGDLLSAGLQVALLHWQRMSEFTADRAGLLACQDLDVAMRTMMKLAGLPPRYYASINTEDFLRQAREFQAMDSDTLSKVAKWLSSMGATHPWTVMRAQQLMLWYDAGSYAEVLKAPQKIPYKLPEGVQGYCANCGWPRRGGEHFCSGCGCEIAQAASTS
jgi:Zn-dependent protease with chaperone function